MLMDLQIEYSRMKQGDESQVFNFISGVFNQFVAPEFSQEGIDEFMKYIQPDELVKHLKSNHFGLMASFKSEIIGAIVVRNYNHVALFFVDARYQRKGIGRELFRMALEICNNQEIKPSQITVNASPNSGNAYKNLQFEATDTVQCVNGIRFIPMALRL